MGIKMSEAFPTKFLSAADLGGRDVKVTIANVGMEDIEPGQPPKPIVHFQGAQKGMVLNKTNANNISVIHGDDSDGWTGKQIVLFTAFVDFKGQTVPAIRVKPTLDGVNAVVPPPAPAADPLDDEIPF